jgi:hypothetical protein
VEVRKAKGSPRAWHMGLPSMQSKPMHASQRAQWFWAWARNHEHWPGRKGAVAGGVAGRMQAPLPSGLAGQRKEMFGEGGEGARVLRGEVGRRLEVDGQVVCLWAAR